MIRSSNWKRFDTEISGFLHRSTVKKETFKIYEKLTGLFWDWVVSDDWEFPITVEELDLLLVAYLENFVNSGHKPYYWGLHLIAGLVLFNPEISSKLFHARTAAKGLRKLYKGKSWEPVSPEISWAVAVWLYNQGREDASLAVLLAFDCYLRISEVVNLELSHISLPGEERFSNHMKPSFMIRDSKTGPNQSVLVDSELVIHLLRRRKKARRGKKYLFGSLRTYTLRRLFNLGIQALGIKKGTYVFHGLRHGSAAFDLYSGYRKMKDIKHRGRWVSDKSCRIYITRGCSKILLASLPRGKAALIRSAVKGHHGELMGLPYVQRRFNRL